MRPGRPPPHDAGATGGSWERGFAAVVGLVALVTAADLLLPDRSGLATLHVLPVLLAIRLGPRGLALPAAALATLAVAVGFYSTASTGWADAVPRALVLATAWSAAVLLGRRAGNGPPRQDEDRASATAASSPLERERLARLLGQAPVALLEVGASGTLDKVAGRALDAMGLPSEEVTGRHYAEVFRELPDLQDAIRRALSGESLERTFRMGPSVVAIHWSPLVPPSASSGALGIATDVSDCDRAQGALRESESRYQLATHGANDGLWDWDLLRHQIHYSARWKAMLGFPADEIETRPEEWLDRVHPDDAEKLRLEIRAHIDGTSSHLKVEHRMRHRDGSYRWMLARGIAVRDGSGKPVRMAGSQTDINDRKMAEQALTHNALHDGLTGLPNRALFVEHLDRAIDRAQRHDDYKFAVLFIDLDRLKVVNDSLGHLAGDEVLVEVGQRLARSLRPGDLAARFGGDEFAVLVDDIKDTMEAIRVAERLHAELRDGLVVGTQEVFTTASIGISLSSDRTTTTPDHILRDADTAMYRAKALGGGRHVVFNRAMHTGAMALLELESDLRRALAKRESRLQTEYQPIVSLESGRIVGFEALGRWLHPQRGVISPSEFIPLAEETGLIVELGRWMLEEACRQMNVWRERFPEQAPLTISVNLSSKQLAQGDLVELVRDVLAATGLPSSSLNLEITESAIMESPEGAAETFQKLKDLGTRLQLDDFGTGYSSLSYLCRFPLDTLKIDRSFVAGLTSGGESREVVRTIVTLAGHLKLSVIAEGVETEAQLVELREIGCTYAQGYHFSRPLGPVAAEALLVAQPHW